MKVITICGSMRFINEMNDIAMKLELEENCVLMPIFSKSRNNKNQFTKEEILILDKMHKEKIKLADSILVVNVDGYIGNSTKSEIDFAKSLNKEIIYYTDIIKD